MQLRVNVGRVVLQGSSGGARWSARVEKALETLGAPVVLDLVATFGEWCTLSPD